MSLNALSNATAGLAATQAAIGIVSQNVANAGTAGYVKRTIAPVATGTNNLGVASGTITRSFDAAALKQLRLETSGASYTSTRSSTLSQLDQLYGTPGSTTAFDGTLNTFTESLQELAANPTSAAARTTVISNASALASQINSAASTVQSMRTGIEAQLGTDTKAASALLSNIANLNNKIQNTTDSGSIADLQDQRDQAINNLSSYMDVQTATHTNGTVSVLTQSGVTLVDRGYAASLSFDGRGGLSANSIYSTDPDKRAVGTITATLPGGGTIDLGASGALRSGTLAAQIELRDQTLPQAQRQLDDLAAGLASSLTDSQRTAAMVSGTATIDLSGAIPARSATAGAGLQAGNALTITVTGVDNVPRNIILVASNADPLPTVTASQTNDASAVTVAFSIKDGPATYADTIQKALDGLTASDPKLPALTVNTSTSPNSSAAANTSGAVLAIASKNAKAPVLAATANVTLPLKSTDLTTGYPQIAMFTDSSSNALYTGSFDSGSQLTGLAQRIRINPAIASSTAALTASSATDSSASGARAQTIYKALTSTQQTFSSSSGIGGVSAPYKASVVGFAQDIIASQGAAAANAAALDATQQTALSTAQSRFSSGAAVNIDQEMSNLITLQTAYGANARILTAARDMLNQLLQV
ncbi:flagellar hook-associated protein 1 FlgK [Methylobacterium sp. UNC300MFChir4.1]|uniref:flagellar hook-associated protein FlgK n=1 Tax=Methylobacterium sp. UNC300MFChir4.1 TaxID=1502747 RepID=UPI0008D020C4|nr:flagellar hook-associated protein FlgK [Methylobacterium sp. UNC300MFChir4.1]SEO46174.1 flagellar hook-associated protein 1 FlgK [Methylobacterium sp. UNC300MFChir4.1]